MCGTCHQYYQRTGHVRPTTAPARRDGAKAGLKYNQVFCQRIIKLIYGTVENLGLVMTSIDIFHSTNTGDEK